MFLMNELFVFLFPVPWLYLLFPVILHGAVGASALWYCHARLCRLRSFVVQS